MFNVLAAVLLLPALLIAAGERRKPDFSGTWRASFTRSKLQMPAPESTVFVIDHREPEFRLTRTHSFAGKSDTWSVILRTDGSETVREEPGRTLRLRLRWQGDALRFSVRLALPGGLGSDDVRYTLSADGRTLTAREKYRDPGHAWDNLWVLERVK
jgi:hypothetical protein